VRVSPLAVAVSVEEGTMMLDKSAATPLAATRKANLMGAGRRYDFRKMKSRGSGWTDLALAM
jgi:hypothetical protein